MAKYTRLLSIDGGGTRGIISACIIDHLESITGKTTPELFDYCGSVSVSSITASMLLLPKSQGSLQPKYKAADIINFFLNKSRIVFQKNWRQNIKTLWGLKGPKYSSEPLNELLNEIFGESKISELLRSLSILFFSLNSIESVVGCTCSAQKSPSDDFYCKDIIAASSAFPIYFAPHVFSSVNKQKNYYGVEGGLAASNPSIVALAKVYSHEKNPCKRPDETIDANNIILVSLGTGLPTRTTNNKIDNYGFLGWMKKGELINDLFRANSQQTADNASMIVTPNQYFRVQPIFSNQNMSLDNADPNHLEKLVEGTRAYIKDNVKKFETIAALLTQ
jgi:uncharacterized protein